MFQHLSELGAAKVKPEMTSKGSSFRKGTPWSLLIETSHGADISFTVYPDMKK